MLIVFAFLGHRTGRYKVRFNGSRHTCCCRSSPEIVPFELDSYALVNSSQKDAAMELPWKRLLRMEERFFRENNIDYFSVLHRLLSTRNIFVGPQ